MTTRGPQKLLSDAEYDRLVQAIRARYTAGDKTWKQIAAEIGVAWRMVHSALHQFTQPGALLRIADYFGVARPAIRPPERCRRGHPYARRKTGRVCNVCARANQNRRRAIQRAAPDSPVGGPM